jgi:hypothetical protein
MSRSATIIPSSPASKVGIPNGTVPVERLRFESRECVVWRQAGHRYDLAAVDLVSNVVAVLVGVALDEIETDQDPHLL